MSRSIRYAVLIPLSVVAFFLLFIEPGTGPGWPGRLVILAGAWVVGYLLWATVQRSVAAPENDEVAAALSPGEQCAWIGLIFTIGILVYFALHSAHMVTAEGRATPQAPAIGRHIAMLIVFWQIAMYVLRQHWRDAVKRDERDRIISARADRGALIALSLFVLGVAVAFAFAPVDRLGLVGPMAISNLMMYGLIASSALGYLVTGVAYWHDRR